MMYCISGKCWAKVLFGELPKTGGGRKTPHKIKCSLNLSILPLSHGLVKLQWLLCLNCHSLGSRSDGKCISGQLSSTYSWPGMSIIKFVRGLVRGHKSRTKERHGFLDLVFVRITLTIVGQMIKAQIELQNHKLENNCKIENNWNTGTCSRNPD